MKVSIYFLSAICLSSVITGCAGEREGEAISGIEDSTARRGLAGHVCGLSMARDQYCPTDFVRLASSPLAADGKELWILGYLAVDDGQVALFASEQDYLYMQHGRSVRLRGTRDQLVHIFSKYGNRMVRLGGVRANDYNMEENDRLGDLLWPITIKAALPREYVGGVDDIRVDLDDLQEEGN